MPSLEKFMVFIVGKRHKLCNGISGIRTAPLYRYTFYKEGRKSSKK